MKQINDTSKNYEDLTELKSEKNIRSDLCEFLGEEKKTKPDVYLKPVDPEFPEQWQNLYVSFDSFDAYVTFCKKLGIGASPKLRTYLFKEHRDDGILNFMGD